MNELITLIGRPLMLLGLITIVPCLIGLVIREMTAKGREP